MFQDTLQAVHDTVAATVPAINSSTDLLLYLSTLIAGGVSGYAVKALGRISATVAGLNEFVRLGVIAVLSYGVLKLAAFTGVPLAGNPLGWDPAAVQAAIAGLLGWGMHKATVKKTTV
jgi:hypothetical protein